MKNFLFFSMLAALIGFASCNQNDDVLQSQTNELAQATFSVQSANTRATVSGLTRYIVEAYEAKDLTATPQHIESSTGSLTLVLKKDTEYTFLFWADFGTAASEGVASSGYYNTTSLQAVQVTDGKLSTAGERAYCLALSFNSKDFEANKAVVLKNAVAELNLIEAAGLTAAGNTMTVTYPGSSKLNVGTGVATEATTTAYTHTFTDIAQVGKDGNIATDYLLAPQGSQTVANISVQLNAEAAKTISNVPFECNYRTNIKGEYSNLYSATFTISREVEEWGTPDNEIIIEPKNVYSNNTEAKAPEKGDGSKENPYLIESGANIKWMQDLTYSTSNDKYYQLTTDIKVIADTWKPIGMGTTFYGHFDGDNHTITGKLTAAPDFGQYNFGFFGTVRAPGSIRNLTNSAEVYAPNVVNVGGVTGCTSAGEVQVMITNCVNTAKITGKYNVAGIAGSYFFAKDVITSGEYPFMSNCRNSGEIIALESNGGSQQYDTSSAAGVVASLYLQPANGVANENVIYLLENCTNSGNVSAPSKANTYVGGIVGIPQVTRGTLKIKGCTNTGTIKSGDKVAIVDAGTPDSSTPGLIFGGEYNGYSGVTVIEN